MYMYREWRLYKYYTCALRNDIKNYQNVEIKNIMIIHAFFSVTDKRKTRFIIAFRRKGRGRTSVH